MPPESPTTCLNAGHGLVRLCLLGLQQPPLHISLLAQAIGCSGRLVQLGQSTLQVTRASLVYHHAAVKAPNS
jgi:hypothetical protein